MNNTSASNSAIQYDEFFGPLFFEPYALEVAKRIDPAKAMNVLEIASGTGRVTRHIRQRILPSAQLIASDISEDMMVVAKNKLSSLPIGWQNIDAQQLPFPDSSIDLVVCCFGYMFVNDKPKAFAEVYRVLKPGGHFILTTWDKLEHNGASYASRSLAKEYLAEPIPESYNLPTSMHDGASIASLLKNAGFSKMAVEKVQLVSESVSAKAAAEGLVEGGTIYESIKEKSPGLIAVIKKRLEKELGEKYGIAPMRAPMSAVLCEAWK